MKFLLAIITAFVLCGSAQAQIGSEMLYPVILNLTMTSANTEYSVAMPTGARHISFQSRDGTAFIYAFATGKVAGVTGTSATPVEPYMTCRTGAAYNFPDKTVLSTAVTTTLYASCTTTGKVVEILVWSNTSQ